MHGKNTAVLIAAALLPLLPACAEKPAAGDDAAPPAAAPAPAPRELTVNAHNYTFDGLPDTIPAGATTIRLTNGGPAPEQHHVNIIQLNGGHTSAEFMDALKTGRMPEWAQEAGGPNVNSVPGQVSVATIDLPAGSYIVVCFVPGPDGVPHVVKGMMKELTVVPATGTAAALPAADIDITLADYNFALSKPLTAGHHVIRVSTAPGMQAHEVVLVKLEPGKTPMDIVNWTEKMQGPPPGAFVGGVSGVKAAFPNTFEVDLAPGEYALICFLPDVKDGRMHAAHGMTQQLTVQ
jgi:hypothetical protein